jgi:putative DNA methylase
MRSFGDLFTPRQLVALTTFSDLVAEARERIRGDALQSGMPDDGRGLDAGGTGATAYAEGICVNLSFALDPARADRGSSICSWDSSPKMEALRNTFGRQAIPMTWDFAEATRFRNRSGNLLNNVDWASKAIERATCIGV